MSNHTVEGFEDLDSRDLAIPRLQIIQGISADILERHKNYNIGNIYNNFTEDQYDGETGILCSLLYHNKLYLEVVPIKEGGGIVAIHSDLNINDFQFSKERSSFIKDGNDLLESHYHLIHMWEPEEMDAMIIMARTQIKKSNIWMTLARMLSRDGDPCSIYEGVYRITVENESRKGFKYKGWNIRRHTDRLLDTEKLDKVRTLYGNAKMQRQKFLQIRKLSEVHIDKDEVGYLE